MDVPQPEKTEWEAAICKIHKEVLLCKSTCVTSRFPYFDSSYLEIPTKVREALKDAQMKLLQVERGHHEKWCGVFVTGTRNGTDSFK